MLGKRRKNIERAASCHGNLSLNPYFLLFDLAIQLTPFAMPKPAKSPAALSGWKLKGPVEELIPPGA